MSVILKWDEEEQESNPPHGTGVHRWAIRLYFVWGTGGSWKVARGPDWCHGKGTQVPGTASPTLLQEPAAVPVFQEPDQAP